MFDRRRLVRRRSFLIVRRRPAKVELGNAELMKQWCCRVVRMIGNLMRAQGLTTGHDLLEPAGVAVTISVSKLRTMSPFCLPWP